MKGKSNDNFQAKYFPTSLVKVNLCYGLDERILGEAKFIDEAFLKDTLLVTRFHFEQSI